MDDRLTQRVSGLSETHRRLLRLAASGATVPDIAVRLNMPDRTVERELTMLFRALGVRNRDEASLLWWGSREGSHPEVAGGARDLIGDDQPSA